MEYDIKDCIIWMKEGIKTIRCPECKNHGINIDSRGDCKNLIKKEDGTIFQCQCYSKEHK